MKKMYIFVLIALFLIGLNSCTSHNVEIFEENGKEYIYLGKQPNSLVEDQSLIRKLNLINNVNEQGYIEYNSVEYIKVIAELDKRLDYDTVFKEGESYYFKVEPIKWEVIKNEGHYLTVLSESFVSYFWFYENNYKNGSIPYVRKINNESIKGNNYQYSTIRAYLNGYDGTSYEVSNFTNKGFYDIAFSNAERKHIALSNVDNMEDYIYILSAEEAREIGIERLNDGIIDNPYYIALGATTYKFYLRTPGAQSTYLCEINRHQLYIGQTYGGSYCEFKAAMKVSLEQINK